MNQTAEPIVRMEHVFKRYGENVVLSDVTLELYPGKVMCIIGPSGAGKSTVLRCVNHLTKINAGRVWFEDELVGYRERSGKLYELRESQVGRMRSRIGMVFQQFNLYGHMTALDNVMFAPVLVQKKKSAGARARAMELLDRVGLADKHGAYPHQLSGGQQQRVAIARALGTDPSLLLFDEPTSALDPEVVAEVLDVMKDLAQSGTTMMVVTHEMGFAADVADDVVFMADGAVVEVGPPDQILKAPQHPRTRDFIRRVH